MIVLALLVVILARATAMAYPPPNARYQDPAWYEYDLDE